MTTGRNNWFANEEFWNTFGDCMFDPDSFRVAARQAPALVALAGGQQHQILDLGCGPGRHAIALAALGQEVTAVDLTSCLLDQGRQQAAQASTGGARGSIDWIQADMRDFRRPDGFDLVICMWSSFGYFDDSEDDLRVLQRCRENLRDGGTLVLDLVGKEIVCRDLQPVHVTEYDNGMLLVERPTLEQEMTVYDNEWTLIRDGQVHQARWHHQLYSGAEIRGLLQEAGFSNVQLQADLEGNPYDFEAQRLMVLAR